MDFQEFPKIGRLSRDMVITEKIDGTNGQIAIGEDGSFHVGSRSRWLTLETGDNFGFLLWATLHRDELIAGLGPGRHFGEWWGCGIQRGYGLQEKRFSLFNVGRWVDTHKDGAAPVGNQRFAPACCHVVPVIQRWSFQTDKVDEALGHLRAHGSFAAPGFMKPEGVVVFHTASGAVFKKTLEKDDEPKSKHLDAVTA